MPVSKCIQRIATVFHVQSQTDPPWQRIVKYSIACIAATTLGFMPELSFCAAFMIPMTVVFAHPGQRLGITIENFQQIIFGSTLGVCWVILSQWIASEFNDTNELAANIIRGFFYFIISFLHAYIRSVNPHLATFTLFFFLPSISTLGMTSTPDPSLFEMFLIPVILGGSISITVNLLIFSESSNSHLGNTTLTTLSEMVDTLERAAFWFTTPGGDFGRAQDGADELDTKVAVENSSAPMSSKIHERVI
ncbi:hypothetical protein PT974_00899 [Cladobotryum mycophilum]|uniref:ER transporter 6TM N-terminal domain-containing protein n=1 Tax=Cladobotryum mycophilum TaxID=491253 RepID=A0ABR0T3C7_9HYPO